MPLTEEQKKERRKERDKKYYEANKQKIKEQSKEYREANKEKIKEQQKGYNKKYDEKNKEKLKEYRKEYYQTENRKKSNRISGWKRNGVISDDYNALYEKYINTNQCELCSISITCGKGLTGKKHLDHCHITGKFRNILCGHCNTKVMRNK
jgi:2-polyprenyl-3-methyl-5-hydroxy-6-metoxy-1,4-benzoquinol methylase